MIKNMTLEELDLLLSWAETEGWNPGIDDAAAFYAADPEGFFVYMKNDQPVAGISVVKQNAEYAFLGLYICLPEYRNKGLGWKVWQAGMHSALGRIVALDGVPAQQENYRKSGFQFAWQNSRYSGSLEKLKGLGVEMSVASPAVDDIGELIFMDEQVGGINRANFLQHWLQDTQTRKTLMATRNGKLQGFGTIRQCVEGYKIGPLLCDDKKIAQQLLLALAQSLNVVQLPLQSPPAQLIIDVPESNTQAVSWISALGFEPAFETARMYKGEAPTVNIKKLFGIATLELG